MKYDDFSLERKLYFEKSIAASICIKKMDFLVWLVKKSFCRKWHYNMTTLQHPSYEESF